MDNRIGERIKQIRKKWGFDQVQFAKELGLSKQTISNYETGIRQPGLDIIINIAKTFSVSTDYILCRIDDENIANIPIKKALPLTNGAIENIRKHCYVRLLNALLESEEFIDILEDAYEYMNDFPVYMDRQTGEEIYDNKELNFRKTKISNNFIKLIDIIQNSGILHSEEYVELEKQRVPEYGITIGKDGE